MKDLYLISLVVSFHVIKFSLKTALSQHRSSCFYECMETRRNELRWSLGIDRIGVECGIFYIGVSLSYAALHVCRRYAGVALFAINFLSLFRSSFIHAVCYMPMTCPIIFRVTHVHSHVLSWLSLFWEITGIFLVLLFFYFFCSSLKYRLSRLYRDDLKEIIYFYLNISSFWCMYKIWCKYEIL